MTFRWFEFGSRSDVTHLFLVLVLLLVFDNLPLKCRAGERERDARKLFGGYRITPTYCKVSRQAKYNRGNTICMFNHECVQRGGEVVGACMDGFLFGACCQLKSDSQSHIPKGPGVVMTSYLENPDIDPDLEAENEYEDELEVIHNSYKPIVTPGYRPGDKNHLTLTTERNVDKSTESEIISEGLSQITNTLLNSPPKDIIKPEKPDSIYTHSTIDHNVADTILLNTNGSLAENIARPSDFHIQVSAMQTKPTVPPTTTTSTTPKTISTHRPVIYTKPVFRPKPLNKTTADSLSTESYSSVAISTYGETKITELSSIDSILQMLNESTPSLKGEVTPPSSVSAIEHKSSPGSTVAPVSYSSGYPDYYSSTGHYITVKPSSSTRIPPFNNHYTTANSIYQDNKPVTTKPFYTSKPSQYTSQAIDIFNRYPVNPSGFDDSLTTFSYVSSSSTTTTTTTSTRKPPSTSYVTGAKPLRRPITPPAPIYDTPAADTFSSVTPTVIVLESLTTKPTQEPQFVEISQEPFKKPVSVVTVNNHVESTNNIFVNRPTTQPKPSSPTVLITPKPGSVTTPFPLKTSSKPLNSITTVNPIFDSYTELYVPSTYKPEVQTSSDDLINNFPPVRNPLLNATGSNPAAFNISMAIPGSESNVITDLEFTTPIWQEDVKLNEKMNVFVNKIVGSLQGTFQELHDIVILDKRPNSTITRETTTVRPKKTTTRRPVTTTKRPVRTTTTTKKPVTVRTTKKPPKPTTVAVRRTTTPPPTTIVTTTKKTVANKENYEYDEKKPGSTWIWLTTKKKQKPNKTVTTTAATTELSDEITTEGLNQIDQIDYNNKNLCGVRPLHRSGRIVGGKNTKFGEWPWQTLVRESTWLGLFTKNKCGGVLISNRFVATAAHCQPGFLASLVAVFGEYDITGNLEPLKPVSKNVKKVIVHRHFDASTFENDLALLELDTPVKFDAHIIPICLPPDDVEFTGRMATVTGWGRLTYAGGVPPILQEVQVPVIENKICQEMFSTSGHQKKIISSFLCAGYANGQKDACEGDSGGPLVVQRDDGHWQLIGTVSHGIRCAAPYLPGVYMRITYYKPWLRSVAGVQ